MDERTRELAALFGGPADLAERLQVGVTSLYHWGERGVPLRHRIRIRRMAEAENVRLPEWFLSESSEAA